MVATAANTKIELRSPVKCVLEGHRYVRQEAIKSIEQAYRQLVVRPCFPGLTDVAIKKTIVVVTNFF